MARGRGGSKHKGGRKQFTDPDELEANRLREQKEREWRRKRGEESSEEEESEGKSSDDDDDDDAVAFKKEASGSGSGSDSESEDDENKKKKGTEGLIDIENPNRKPQRLKKVSELDAEVAGASGSVAGAVAVAAKKPELSRREREELEKQRAKAHYQKLHAAGKTEEAQADLARLAIIRKQREEAAKKREDERLAKENVGKAKTAETGKALGKAVKK